MTPIELVTQALPKTRRLRRPRKQREPRNIERAYWSELKSINGELWKLVDRLLLPELPRIARIAGIRSDDTRADQFGWPAILREIFADIRKQLEAVDPRIQAAAEEAAQQTSIFNRIEIARQMRGVVGVDIFYNDPKLVDTLEEFTAANVSKIKSIPAGTLDDMEQIVSNGFRGGRRASEVAKQIRDRYDVSQSKAKFLARDQIGSLNGQLTKQRQEVIGIDRYVWRTSMDERVRKAHAAMEGRSFSWDDPPKVGARRVHPGEDYNCRCLIGNTVINGFARLDKLFRRQHTGQVCTITLDSGKTIAATSNHPILTREGFKPIQSLNLGDDVLTEVNQSRNGVEFDRQCRNIQIGQLFAAFHKCGITRTVSVKSGSDFHGDATTEEVDLIALDRELMNERYAIAIQKCGKLGLSDASQMDVLAFLTRISFENPWSSDSIMRGADLIGSLLIRHLSPFDFFSLAWRSDFYSGLVQSKPDTVSSGAKPLRDCIFACARLIEGNDFIVREIEAVLGGTVFPTTRIHPSRSELFGDGIGIDTDNTTNLDERMPKRYQFRRLVDAANRYFSGHVYNLQTANTAYVAATMMVGNCTAEPVIRL